MLPGGGSPTSVNFYRTKRRHILEDRTPNNVVLSHVKV
jgi:hypothetical protein